MNMLNCPILFQTLFLLGLLTLSEQSYSQTCQSQMLEMKHFVEGRERGQVLIEAQRSCGQVFPQTLKLKNITLKIKRQGEKGQIISFFEKGIWSQALRRFILINPIGFEDSVYYKQALTIDFKNSEIRGKKLYETF